MSLVLDLTNHRFVYFEVEEPNQTDLLLAVGLNQLKSVSNSWILY